MSVVHLAQLRVARFFIRNMITFSVCEHDTYHEQESSDWKSCSRETTHDFHLCLPYDSMSTVLCCRDTRLSVTLEQSRIAYRASGQKLTIVTSKRSYLPEAGFGVSEIYERVPNEDEDFGGNEMGVGHRTDDGFEGEETYEDSWEEDSENF
jgi:hypothetical protein